MSDTSRAAGAIEGLVAWARPRRRVLAQAGRVIARSTITRMAAALAYRTVFGLIPVLAIGVAVLGNFASQEQVSAVITRVLELTGISEIVVRPQGVENEEGAAALDEWIQALVTKVRGISFVAIGLTGLFMLGYAAISFMVEIERSANHIYRAPTGRSWVRRVTQYWTTLTLGSIFLVGTFSVGDRFTEWIAGLGNGEGSTGASLAAQAAGAGANTVINFVLLLFIYVTVPNARVSVRCAAAGAMLAAVGWELGKWAFRFVVVNSMAQTLYGAIALVPLFLLWVYITWVIVLSGLQVSYMLQHFRAFVGTDPEREGPVLIDPLALVRVATEVGRSFARGEKCSADRVANALELDDRATQTLLDRLVAAGVVHEVPEGREDHAYVLARPASEVSCRELLEMASELSTGGGGAEPDSPLEGVCRAQLEAASHLTLADLTDHRPGKLAARAPKDAGEGAPASARPAAE